jgi:DNA-directed RNA polymerase subunit M/transcription elongation factor TFIIS
MARSSKEPEQTTTTQTEQAAQAALLQKTAADAGAKQEEGAPGAKAALLGEPRRTPKPEEAVDYIVVECPGCLSKNTEVLPHQDRKKSDGTWRLRKCRECKKEFKEALPHGTKNAPKKD